MIIWILAKTINKMFPIPDDKTNIECYIDHAPEGDHKLSIPVNEMDNSYKKWFSELSTLNADDIICKSNCKICNHDLRFDAEAKWEQTHSLTSVCMFLNQNINSDSGIKFTVDNVRNHMYSHYADQQKRLWLKDYGSKLSAMMNYKISKDSTLEAILTSLHLKFMEIASDPTLGSTKQSESMSKVAKTITEVIRAQSEIRGEIKTTQVVVEKFTNIWVNLITSFRNDPVTQKLLLEQLETFRRDFIDVLPENNNAAQQ